MSTAAWVWPARYCAPGESAWLTAHKFGYLNGLASDSLCRALLARGEDVLHTSSTSRLFARIAEQRRDKARPDCGSDVLRARTLEESFGPHQPRMCNDSVRYCPRCLDQWFHSSAFQLTAVERCPAHNCPLETGCPSCRKLWNVSYKHEEFSRPLHCHHCGRPFAGREARFDEVLPIGTDARTPTYQFLQQVEVACARTDVCKAPATVWEALGDRRKMYFHGLWTANRFVANRFLTPGVLECTYLPRSAGRQTATAAAMNAYCATVRSIGAQARRRVRKACGHTADLIIGMNRRGQLSGHQGQPEYSEVCCACCYVLAKWKTQYSTLFRLRREMQKFGIDDARLHWEWWGSPQTPAWTADYALSSFGFTALVVSIGLGVGVEYYDASRRRRDPYKLDTFGDYQLLHGLRESLLAPVFRTADGWALLRLPSEHVKSLLEQLSRVSSLHLRYSESDSIGSTYEGRWGEAAAEWCYEHMWMEMRKRALFEKPFLFRTELAGYSRSSEPQTSPTAKWRRW